MDEYTFKYDGSADDNSEWCKAFEHELGIYGYDEAVDWDAACDLYILGLSPACAVGVYVGD